MIGQSLTQDSVVLFTGATGLIGGELLYRMLGQKLGQIYALVRPQRSLSPQLRLQSRLNESGPVSFDLSRLQVVAGDITAKLWDLEPAVLAKLYDTVDIIIHNAADTSFAPDRRPEDTNISSVEHLIGLAKRCRKNPLIVYMSTASNVGEAHNACLTEEEGCQTANDHFNSYTHSKAIAEKMLLISGLPVLILRPSIVLSAGLTNKRFASQILWCLPVTRLFRGLPLDAHSRLDLVDVGFVADAALKLMQKSERQYACYHLSAGPRNATTVGEMCHLLDVHYRRRPLQLIAPESWSDEVLERYAPTKKQKRLFQSLEFYLPFINMDVVFHDGRLRSELGSTCPQLRQLKEYLPALADLISEKSAMKESIRP